MDIGSYSHPDEFGPIDIMLLAEIVPIFSMALKRALEEIDQRGAVTVIKRNAPPSTFRGMAFSKCRLATLDRLRQGKLPKWNPLSSGGDPVVGQVLTCGDHPPHAPSRRGASGGLDLTAGPGRDDYATRRRRSNRSPSDRRTRTPTRQRDRRNQGRTIHRRGILSRRICSRVKCNPALTNCVLSAPGVSPCHRSV